MTTLIASAPAAAAASPTPIFVSVPEACTILGVGRTQMFALLAAKAVQRVKIGAKTLVPMESLEQFAARLISEQSAQPED